MTLRADLSAGWRPTFAEKLRTATSALELDAMISTRERLGIPVTAAERSAAASRKAAIHNKETQR